MHSPFHHPHTECEPLEPCIEQKDILARLARADKPLDPVFYEDGIIDGGLGYYQLARLNDGRKILLYGRNIEDMQKVLPPLTQGIETFRYPEKLAGVDVFNDQVSSAMIRGVLQRHQNYIQQEQREELCVFDTGNNIHQSRPATYARQTCSDVDHTHHFHAYSNALQGIEFPVPYRPSKRWRNRLHDQYLRLHYPQTCLHGFDQATSRLEEIKTLLDHHNALTKDMIEGRDPLLRASRTLTKFQRRRLKARIWCATLAHKCVDRGKEMYEKRNTIEPYLAVIRVGWAVCFKAVSTLAEMTFQAVRPLIGQAIEILGVSKEVQEFVHTEHAAKPHKPSKALQKFVRKKEFTTRLNEHSHMIDPAKIGFLHPLDVLQADLVATNAESDVIRNPMVKGEAYIKSDPFTANRLVEPEPGSISAPMATVVLLYKQAFCRVQGNGLWNVVCEDVKGQPDKMYVGYNKNLDLNYKPYPSPQLVEWLDNGRIICLDMKKLGCPMTEMNLSDATDLDGIRRSQDGDIIAADKPTNRPVPRLEPRPEQPAFQGIMNPPASAFAPG